MNALSFFNKDYLEKGLVLFTFGDEDVKTDFLHVDNLVQAHVKAAAALMLPESIPVSYAIRKDNFNVFCVVWQSILYIR